MGSKHQQIWHFDNIPFAEIGKFRYRDKEKQMKILHLFTTNWIRTSTSVCLQPQGFLIKKLAWSNQLDPQNAVRFVCWNSRNKCTKQMNTCSVATKENNLRMFEAHLFWGTSIVLPFIKWLGCVFTYRGLSKAVDVILVKISHIFVKGNIK